MLKILRSRWAVFLAVTGIIGLTAAAAQAGIRMDGTEFQSGSRVTTTTVTRTADASTAVPNSANRKLVFTMGQAILAYGEIENSTTGQAVKIGLGYDFNAQHKTDFGCTCIHQGEANADGVKDAIDLSAIIDALFYNGENFQDPLCPTVRFDTDCDGLLTALDLNQLIEQLYFNGPPPCNPCFGL